MASLFAQILGRETFAQLAAPLQRLHEPETPRTYRGTVDVERGSGILARLCAWAADLPPSASAQKVDVEILPTANGERWTRAFGKHIMRSNLTRDGNYLREHLGLLHFRFALIVADGRLTWSPQRVSALGIRLPIRWFRRSYAIEYAVGDIYHFDVRAHLPIVGCVVHYAGSLQAV